MKIKCGMCSVETISNIEPKLDVVRPHPVPLPQEGETRRPVTVIWMSWFQVAAKVSTEQIKCGMADTRKNATWLGEPCLGNGKIVKSSENRPKQPHYFGLFRIIRIISHFRGRRVFWERPGAESGR